MNDWHAPYRWTKKPLENIKYYLQCIKFTWQRGFRGWADCDCWSIDWHISKIMIPMLKQMRDNKMSFPCGLDDNSDLASQKWDTILNDIIAGFEASRRIQELDYEDDVEKGVQADIVIFEKGMKLFVEFYFNLWD